MFKGHAQSQPSLEFLQSKGVHPDQQRSFAGVTVSSAALGTYLGGMDFTTDMRVTKACLQAVDAGVNFFDSAINYRGQRGERSIGEAIRQLFLKGAIKREQLFVSTKGGFVPFEGEPVEDMKKLFHEQYVANGIATEKDLVAECHCMTPRFLDSQLERSRKNLGLETIDLYYIHNPETQLEEYPERIFYERLFDAFVFLEKARAEGRIMSFGLATWDGFREVSTSHGYLNLAKVLDVARSAAPAGGESGFRAIQLPFNLAMLEAGFLQTQNLHDETLSTIEAARVLEIDVAVSAPLLQGRLSGGLPPFITKHFDQNMSDALISLEFVASVAGVGAAMVGMKDPRHVAEDVQVLKRPKMTTSQIQMLLKSIMTQT